MTVLVLGATGATGSLVVQQLLERNINLKIIVRSVNKIPNEIVNNKNIQIIEASISDISKKDLKDVLINCDTVISCLGHNLSCKGLFGHPKKLVSNGVKNICEIANAQTSSQLKFILMNSSGVRNKDLNEPISLAQKMVIGLLKVILPPHLDNELAANYLREKQTSSQVNWVAVRPDGLTNNTVSKYHAFPSPTRSAIFDAGEISRINVAHFMAELITDKKLWDSWQGKMPVLYGE